MRSIVRLAGLAMVLLATSAASFAAPKPDDASGQKAVLVTGASTGIGRKITEVLAANGYFVYAGARKQKDLDDLNEIENVQSIRLDVTIQEEIDAAPEMAQFDVQVSVIEPGNYRSEISKTSRTRTGELSDAQRASPYADYYQRRTQRTGDRSHHKDPDEVAEAALHALFDENPKHRYMVVPNREEAGWTIGTILQEMVQLNERQVHSFSRDEIIGMLDEAMAAEGE